MAGRFSQSRIALVATVAAAAVAAVVFATIDGSRDSQPPDVAAPTTVRPGPVTGNQPVPPGTTPRTLPSQPSPAGDSTDRAGNGASSPDSSLPQPTPAGGVPPSGADDPGDLGRFVANVTSAKPTGPMVVGARLARRQLHAGETTTLFVDLATPPSPEHQKVSVTVMAPPGIDLGDAPKPWNCQTGAGALTCERPAGAWPKTLALPVTTAADTRGLHGMTAVAWLDDLVASPQLWQQAMATPQSNATMLSVLAPRNQAPLVGGPSGEPQMTAGGAAPGVVAQWVQAASRHFNADLLTGAAAVLATRGYPADHSSRSVSPLQGDLTPAVLVSAPDTTTTTVDPSPQPPPAFCTLFDAAGSIDGTVEIGSLMFSRLSNSSGSSGPCNQNSTITISGADLTVGSVLIGSVTGTATPTSLELSAELAPNEINIDIKDTFPGPGTTELSGSVSVAVGGVTIDLQGDLDYTDPDQFTVTVSATESGWEPLPGLTIAQGGISGTYTRTSTSQSAEIDIELSGTWKPVPAVAVTDISARLGFDGSELSASFSGSVDGAIDVAGVSIDVPAKLTGSLLPTGALELEADIQPVTFAGLVTLGPATTRLSYVPGTASQPASETATVSGDASFAGEVATFFDGSVQASMSITELGYVVTAAMDSGPPSGSDAFGPLTFALAGTFNPADVWDFRFPGPPGGGPGGGSAPNVTVPIVPGTPVAVVPFGVPTGLRDITGFTLLDDVGTGVARISLDPTDPGFSVFYEPPPDTYLFGSAGSTPRLQFDDIFVSVALGATESFAIGGDVTLTLSDGTTLAFTAELDVDISETGWDIDGELNLVAKDGWINPLGISGLTLDELSIGVGISDIAPSLKMAAVATFPPQVTEPLGITADAVISMGFEISLADPCFEFSVRPPDANPGTPVVNIADGTLTATAAEIYVAPQGCTLGGTAYPPGYHLQFTGAVASVETDFTSTFSLDPFAFSASGDIGKFTIGGLTFDKTSADLDISDATVDFGLSVQIDAGSLNGSGTIRLESSGGFDLEGSGIIDVGSSGASVVIKATNCADATCSTLTTASFFAQGTITTKGFDFAASLKINAEGVFDATLQIPSSTHGFNLSNSSIRASGTVSYAMFLDVANTGLGELRVSASVDLKSCSYKLGLIWPRCPTGKVSLDWDIKAAEVDFTVGYSLSFPKIRFSISVDVKR